MQTKTLTMQASTGKVLTFDGSLRGVNITARSECWVLLVNTNDAVPSAPVASPAPAGNATTNYIHLLAGESRSFAVPAEDRDALGVKALAVWPVLAGELEVLGF
jgi:hypothetical protein